MRMKKHILCSAMISWLVWHWPLVSDYSSVTLECDKYSYFPKIYWNYWYKHMYNTKTLFRKSCLINEHTQYKFTGMQMTHIHWLIVKILSHVTKMEMKMDKYFCVTIACDSETCFFGVHYFTWDTCVYEVRRRAPQCLGFVLVCT